MSTPARSDAHVHEHDVREAARRRFTTWPGQLVLMASWLLPPLLVLANQQISYMTIPWACARRALPAIHIVPVLCLIAVGVCFWLSLGDWRRTGGGRDEDAATVFARSRFLALLGLAVSVYSALIILAMWLPLWMFDPCVS